EPKSDILPGITLVREAGTRVQVKQRILPSPSAEVSAKFDELNTHLPDNVLPGTLVVLSDPENTSQMCTQQEEELRQQAVRAQQTVQWLEPPEAQALVDHYGPLRDFALLDDETLGNVSTDLGAFSAAGTEVANKMKKNLQTIEGLYRDTLNPERKTSRAQFTTIRDSVFKELDQFSEKWINSILGIPDDAQELKAKIGVATATAVSKTETALTSYKDFKVPSVSEAIVRAGHIIRGLSIVNLVGIGIDTYATTSRVEEACSSGRADECNRVRFKEYGALAGRVAGGSFGGSLLASAAAQSEYLCLAIGLHPAGRLVCVGVAAGTGAVSGGYVGDTLGEMIGNGIYKSSATDKSEQKDD
ncbi:hypothetical protein ACFQPR_14860, partial [Larsenimonas suaedae]